MYIKVHARITGNSYPTTWMKLLLPSSLTPRKKLQNQLLQRALFQPPQGETPPLWRESKVLCQRSWGKEPFFYAVPWSLRSRILQFAFLLWGVWHKRRYMTVPFHSVSDVAPQGTANMLFGMSAQRNKGVCLTFDKWMLDWLVATDLLKWFHMSQYFLSSSCVPGLSTGT